MSIARKIGNLGTALDSAALSTFLSKGTTDGEFDTIAWGDVTGKPSYIDSALATQLFDSAYVQLRQSAVSSGGLDSAAVVSLIDSSYVAARAGTGSSGFVMYNYNATAGQTAFQDSDTAGNVLSYTADGILVYYNGLLLADEDYTATDGSAVTLTEGADSGAQITIGKWNLTGSSSSSGGSSFTWGGDRAVISGGYNTTSSAGSNVIQYYDITATGNATDFGDLVQALYYSGACSNSTYGVTAGGYNGVNAYLNTIQYFTISTTSNTSDFGDLTTSYKTAGASNGTYGLWFRNAADQTIDYVTIATPSNATDFGDCGYTGAYVSGTGSDETYVLLSGGYSGTYLNTIHYVTADTPSNSTDFGDMTVARLDHTGTSNTTYTIFAGNDPSASNTNVIDYVTTATPSNATDFGDLTTGGDLLASASNADYATFAGRFVSGTPTNTIDYVAYATPSNASDFGDLLSGLYGGAGCSGSPS